MKPHYDPRTYFNPLWRVPMSTKIDVFNRWWDKHEKEGYQEKGYLRGTESNEKGGKMKLKKYLKKRHKQKGGDK